LTERQHRDIILFGGEEMKKWMSSEYMMEDNGSFETNEIRYYIASEVDAERAKDREEMYRENVAHAIMTDTQNKLLKEKDAEIARLRRALEKYGNKDNWGKDSDRDGGVSRTHIFYYNYPEGNGWEVAREALERE
jgi:hypothetical protein